MWSPYGSLTNCIFLAEFFCSRFLMDDTFMSKPILQAVAACLPKSFRVCLVFLLSPCACFHQKQPGRLFSDMSHAIFKIRSKYVVLGPRRLRQYASFVNYALFMFNPSKIAFLYRKDFRESDLLHYSITTSANNEVFFQESGDVQRLFSLCFLLNRWSGSTENEHPVWFDLFDHRFLFQAQVKQNYYIVSSFDLRSVIKSVIEFVCLLSLFHMLTSLDFSTQESLFC